MRTFKSNGLRLQGAAALESHPEGRGGEGAEEVVVVPEGVPEEIVELNQADEVVAQDESDTAEIEAAIEGLESIRIFVGESLQDQGMTAREARALNFAIESHTSRIGVQIQLPSQEAFGGTGPRTQATRVAMEGLSDALTKLWNWLVDMLTKAKKNIIDYYERVWAEAPRQIKKLEALRDRAAAITKAPDGDNKEVEVSKGVAAKLNIAGKLTDISSGLDKLTGVSEGLFGGYLTGAVAWADTVTTAVGNLTFTDDAAFTTSVDAVKAIKPLEIPAGLADKEANADVAKGAEGVTLKMSDVLLGNKAVIHQSAALEDGASLRDTIAAIGKNQLRLQDAVSEQPKFESAVKMPTPSAKDLESIAGKAQEIANKVQSFKRNWAKTDEAKTKALSKVKSIKSKVNAAKDLSSENQSAATAALKLLGTVPSVVDQPNQGFTAYLLTTNAAVISFVETCLAKYK